MTKKRQVPLSHPGEILNEEFLKPLHMTPNALALPLHVPSNRIYGIIEGERSISADTALRLGRYFSMSAEFWVNLQSHYDLEMTKERSEHDIEEQIRPRDTPA
jgi:addiction module HigA family antidote